MEELNQIFSNEDVEITKEVWMELVKEVDENGDGEVFFLISNTKNVFNLDFIFRIQTYDGKNSRRENRMKFVLLGFLIKFSMENIFLKKFFIY